MSNGEDASATLVECTLNSNGQHGLRAYGESTVSLRGGTISGNKLDGVHAEFGAKVTVATVAQRGRKMDRPQTLSLHNERHDWAVCMQGAIINIPEEKITQVE